jgi:Acyl-CoA dehydrogenase, C-terminal domain
VIQGEDLELFERSLRHATEQSTPAELDTALDELGWSDALAEDPRTAISTLFELQGAANASSSALGHVVTNGLGVVRAPSSTVVLPAIARWDPPGRIEGPDLALSGVADATLSGSDSAVVVSSTGEDIVTFTVPTSSLEVRAVGGIDPSLGLSEVTASGIPAPGEPDVVTKGWPNAVALARLAVAHELVGASRTMLELAREHALERIQFDRPISSFQAVRHRLAEALVAIEMADAALDAAWLDHSWDTAAMAKSVAGRGARTTARHCQQVLAGIGFTTEHPLHRYVRRVLVLDGLFGTAATLTRAFGDEVISNRHLPPLLPL